MAAATDPARSEANALRLSAGAGLALAVVGIVWGLAVASQIILFDGLYAVLGFVLSWLGIRAAAKVEAKQDGSSDFEQAHKWYGRVLKCEPGNTAAKKGQDDTQFEF